MHAEYLVKMLNEIAAFFEGECGVEGAPREVARHVQRFWDRRMRAALVAHLAAGGAGLNAVARGAAGLVAAAEQAKTAS